jgi:hypothetical protein
MVIASTLAALVITISAPADVSPAFVTRVVDEAEAIWRPAGLAILWERQSSHPIAPDGAAVLDVVIGGARGIVDQHESDEPIAWILFDGATPRRQVYLSYANAMDFLRNSRGVVGLVSSMPNVERDTYLGRVLGRALAHELGHYLLSSKVHTPTGLMKARHTAAEFFSRAPTHFEITAAQRIAAEMRLGAIASITAAAGGSSEYAPRPSIPHLR